LLCTLLENLSVLAQALIVAVVGIVFSHVLEQSCALLEQFHASAEQDVAFDALMETETVEDQEAAYQVYLEKCKRHDELILRNR